MKSFTPSLCGPYFRFIDKSIDLVLIFIVLNKIYLSLHFDYFLYSFKELYSAGFIKNSDHFEHRLPGFRVYFKLRL